MAADVQLGREVDHLRHVVRCPRVLVRPEHVQGFHIRREHRRVMLGDLPHRPLLGACGDLDLVLALIAIADRVADVGDVDDLGDGESLPLQHSAQRVAENVGPHVP